MKQRIENKKEEKEEGCPTLLPEDYIDLSKIETTLKEIPYVKKVTVITVRDTVTSAEKLIAYYVLHKQGRMPTSLNKSWVFLVAECQVFCDEIYKNGELNDAQFNLVGWKSSFTGQSLFQEEMHEWLSETVKRIKSLNPKNVLEIGCGTGLLTFSLHKFIKYYIGIDFSSKAIADLKAKVSKLSLSHVELHAARADELLTISKIHENHLPIDTIILNSVVQYFPSINYLESILLKAINVIKKGHIPKQNQKADFRI